MKTWLSRPLLRLYIEGVRSQLAILLEELRAEDVGRALLSDPEIESYLKAASTRLEDLAAGMRENR